MIQILCIPKLSRNEKHIYEGIVTEKKLLAILQSTDNN